MNVQKVLLGTLLVQPELASYALPVLDISDFAPDVQPIFAALQGFWISTGILDTVQICARYPAQKAAVMGCVEEYSAECVRPTRFNVEAWVRIVQEQAALTRFQSYAVRIAMEKGDDEPDSLIPALFAIHRYIDIFADQLSAECRTYFEAVQTAKAEKKMNSNMTDEEFLKALREHPELIPQVMQILTQEKQEVHPAG